MRLSLLMSLLRTFSTGWAEDSVKKRTPPYTLNEREHLRMVTRLRFWGRSSESFAREWDRGGRFARVPALAIPGRGHAVFSLQGFANGHSSLIAAKLSRLFHLARALQPASPVCHAPTATRRN